MMTKKRVVTSEILVLRLGHSKKHKQFELDMHVCQKEQRTQRKGRDFSWEKKKNIQVALTPIWIRSRFMKYSSGADALALLC
jgi:hypothetical protein